MIKLADCKDVAESLGVDPEVVLACARVESNGEINSFLFEPHQFSRITGHIYDDTHPDLSYPVWDPNGYPKTKFLQQQQFDRATILEPIKAYEATSWGLFQIMGYHYHVLDYGSALTMATDLKASIEANVKAFGKMIKYMHLVDALKVKNWTHFARIYNGPSYLVNHYDTKIASNYDAILKSNAGSSSTT